MDNLGPPSLSSQLRVCFVGLYANSLFSEKTYYQFGGAEVRSFLFSTALARMTNHVVSYVVADHGQPRFESLHGVGVYAHEGYRTSFGPRWIWGLREALAIAGPVFARTGQFPYRRLLITNRRIVAEYALVRIFDWLVAGTRKARYFLSPSLWIGNYEISPVRFKVYEEIDADIYCVFGVTNLAGEVAAFCRNKGKRFVLFLADETNLDTAYTSGVLATNVYGDWFHVCQYAISHADLIIAQLESQRELLWQRFARKAITIRNPIDLTQSELQVMAGPEARKIALWIGRADSFKKMPLLFIELTKAFPNVEFVMVMNPHIPEVSHQVYYEKPDNVTIYEKVPYHQIDTYFARAFVFVSTSLTEGFPNTFLQAGRWGVPVLSYCVDPDNFIERFDCGIVAHGDMANMIAGFKEIQADAMGPRRYSENMLNYVRQYHGLDDRTIEVDKALQELAQQGASATGRLPMSIESAHD